MSDGGERKERERERERERQRERERETEESERETEERGESAPGLFSMEQSKGGHHS